MTHLGDQVQIRRESKGWSRARLASMCGLTENGVRLLETGRREDAMASTVCKLAGALGVTPDALLLLDESQGPLTTNVMGAWRVRLPTPGAR
jgi:transcriptional regulator with XRE-family HTH domain